MYNSSWIMIQRLSYGLLLFLLLTPAPAFAKNSNGKMQPRPYNQAPVSSASGTDASDEFENWLQNMSDLSHQVQQLKIDREGNAGIDFTDQIRFQFRF